MKQALAGLGLSLALVAGAPAPAIAWNADASLAALDLFSQRRDVDEVLLPPAPDGPATPIPFCAPSAPVCP